MNSKIRRATVTGAELDSRGSVTIECVLMDKADLVPHEQVHVLDMDNEARFQTYLIEAIQNLAPSA